MKYNIKNFLNQSINLTTFKQDFIIMKVVHIVFGMEYGGIETMLVNIMNEHIKHADISLIIVTDKKKNP